MQRLITGNKHCPGCNARTNSYQGGYFKRMKPMEKLPLYLPKYIVEKHLV